ncbi:MAG: undecaprenyl-diphosphatase UppP [candidate division Zixibacteria bacterium]|nr:undecaprenyl-diphosphatase UppP [candidate division Zixibacteria bacterium]
MTLVQAIILGIVQGATEFIPVSSSGHLVLVPHLLKWKLDPEIAFAYDVLVHWGTLGAVLIYFRNDLWKFAGAALRGIFSGRPFQTAEARLAWLLIAATIPAGVIGLALADFFEMVFGSPLNSALFLLGTALILTWSEKQSRPGKNMEQITLGNALFIGLGQALAIFPGLSRSGATIAAGLWCGLDRVSAARFSFLMSVPVILGAGLLPLRELVQTNQISANLPALCAGFAASIITGYICIDFLMKFLQRRKLYVFALYCLIFGGLNLALLWLK